MENKAYIYKKLLVITGKYYIGKHNGKKLNYKGSGTDWLEDYKKFVKNPLKDIKTEVLEYVEDISKLNERETFWLKYFDAANNTNFYNRSNISHGCHITKELTKELQSKSSPFRKEILQYDLEGNFIKKWDCMSDASKYYNISTGDLTCCCKGKQLTVKNYIWVYYTENYTQKIPPRIPYNKSLEFRAKQSLKLKGKKRTEEQKQHRYKPILQYDLEGNFIKKFKCIREACYQFGDNVDKIESNIGACCKGKQKTAYKYVWKYA